MIDEAFGAETPLADTVVATTAENSDRFATAQGGGYGMSAAVLQNC